MRFKPERSIKHAAISNLRPIKIEAFLGLEVLLDFLLEQVRSDDDEDGSKTIGSTLGDMHTLIWLSQDKNVLWAWHDSTTWLNWNKALESLEKDEGFSTRRPVALVGQAIFKKEQVFVAAFNFLNDHFFESDHDMSFYTVMHQIARCIADLKKEKSNALWLIWLQYLEVELKANNEYGFDESLKRY